jgi:hypothetical protein
LAKYGKPKSLYDAKSFLEWLESYDARSAWLISTRALDIVVTTKYGLTNNIARNDAPTAKWFHTSLTTKWVL